MIKVFSKIRYFLNKETAKLAIIPLLAFLIPTKFAFAFSFNPIDWVKGAMNITSSLLFFPLEFIIDLIFRVVFVAVNFILGTLVKISAWIFNWSLMLSMESENYKIVKTGWEVSLAFANNFFVLIFLGIAIATILRLEQFNYKKMLPTFIMVALLINFSLVIGKVIIDVTNIFTISFSNQILTASKGASQGSSEDSASSMGGQGDASTTIAAKLQVQAPIKKLNDQFNKMVEDGDTTTTGFTGLFSTFLYQIFVYLVTIFTFLAGAVYMISRAFWLWLLLMLAPLAWISLIIPGQKKHWTMWWDKFIKWCIFAPVYLFFLMLGLQIGNITAINGEFGTLSAAMIINTAVVGFIMISGVFIADKMGVGGSNFVINYAKNAQKAASKKFKDLRSKSPLSAENIGKKFGGMGAGLLAKSRLGAVAGYGKETREKLELEKAEEKTKKAKLVSLRADLKKSEMPFNEKMRMKEYGYTREEIKEYVEAMKAERMTKLQALRAATGQGKVDFEKELEKLLAKQKGAPPASTTSPSPGGATP